MKRKVGALQKVDLDLASLQYKIRKDPKPLRLYEDEFGRQYAQYQSQREIFSRQPSSATDAEIVPLQDLIELIAHVADCYEPLTHEFPSELEQLLTEHHHELESELREKIVCSLVLLKKKKIIDSSRLLHTLFPILTTTPSKALRALLFTKILSDLRTSNTKTKDHRLNRTIQTVLYNLLTADPTSSKGLWAVKLTRELWKRQVWTESKAVEIMKEAALADNEKVIVGGVRFFLGGDKEREEMQDESSDEEAVDIGRIKHQIGINKKSRKKAKALENAVAVTKRKERKKKQPHPLNFSAFHLLHDPQGFAEALFAKHLQNNKSKLNLEQKLLVLQLLSRLVGLHKLTLLSLYSYFIKYLSPRQPSVTSFLASLAQATHSLVPPDVLEPLVQKIANEFVSEAAASEVASAGLNAIREICSRQPLAMNDTLLQDLVMYRKSKDKGVMMASKGLLSLYRDVGADMLKKRDRGKDAAMGIRAGTHKELKFGAEAPGKIEGLDLLEKWREEEKRRRREEIKTGMQSTSRNEGQDTDDEAEGGEMAEDDWEDKEESSEGGWEVDAEESEDSGGWIDVVSDTDIDISDSDDEKPAKKKVKMQASKGKENVGKSAGALESLENEVDEVSNSEPTEAADTINNLATTRILTPADLAKLHELRLKANIQNNLPASQRKRAAQQIAAQQSRHVDDPLTAAEIEGLAFLSNKASKEEKMALARDGKAERSEHKSTQAIRKAKKESEGKSTTNKEKARKKNFMMTLGKAKGKQKRSLVEKGRVLKAHIERGKRGGRRGNRNAKR